MRGFRGDHPGVPRRAPPRVRPGLIMSSLSALPLPPARAARTPRRVADASCATYRRRWWYVKQFMEMGYDVMSSDPVRTHRDTADTGGRTDRQTSRARSLTPGQHKHCPCALNL